MQVVVAKELWLNMKKLIFLIVLVCTQFAFSQSKLDKLLKKNNTESVPYIYTEDLEKDIENVFLLDAREPKEYKVSHIDKAICVGYNKFNIDKTLAQLPKDKNTKIVVYCSLGIRSEDVAEAIQKEGYSNVYNLYGGIFEWKNNDNIVIDPDNKPTEKVHSFNKFWGKWLNKGTKVYD